MTLQRVSADERTPSRASVRLGAATLLVLLALSCGFEAEPGNAPRCGASQGASAVTEGLVNGSDSAGYLALSRDRTIAIGKIESPAADALCTGIRVAETWALSARHCAFPGARFVDGDGSPSEVVEWLEHPDVDVALARLSPGCGRHQVLPIARPGVHLERLARASLAGYGLTEKYRAGGLSFLVERVVHADALAIDVSGFGQSGACVGDSGGPLLVRDSSGQAAVLGVLSVGASSCVGEDRYVRVDRLLDWIEQTTGALPVSDACEAITSRGRCFEGQAVWCDDGRLAAELCEDPARCGYNPSAGGFRCSRAPSCEGDEFGTCDSAGGATLCSESGLKHHDCATLGLDCGYDPRTGIAACR
ncbi:MAG TPA: trypsin-like serine protease [Polyangiaceae bacterium]|nr:trypsin-like serine protease [Polyangiaceae bacterium]